MTDTPNILLITTDQHHHEALGHRTTVLQTPHLDRLAGEGARFDRAYCPNPLCSPSRSSLITGRYPSAHGCWTLGTRLDDGSRTIGELLGAAGYATSLIGKAHFEPLAATPEQPSLERADLLRDLEFWAGFHGPYFGFQHIELARNHADERWAGQHYALWMERQGLADWRRYFQGGPGDRPHEHAWDLPEAFHYTHFVAERTVAAMDHAMAAGRPFFTWASFQDPHPPYLVPEPWASMYDPADVEPGEPADGELEAMPEWFRLTQLADPDFSAWQETEHANHGFVSHLVAPDRLRRDLAVYYGMISLVDAGIGRLLAYLDERGLAGETLVVFTTDHGHFLGQHGLTAKGPFHYEDLIRIPMLARFPGRIPTGRRVSALQSLVDLAPTFLHAADLPVPGDMQGVNQLGVWSGTERRVRDHVLVENRHQPTAVHIRTYVDERYKMTLYRDQPVGELFDLQADPGERSNLFDDPAHADLRAEVMHRFLNAEIRREASTFERIAVA
ncbi:DUF4976 domain-containing protein [Jiangella aurantiaca]|uniref:DUF4976 domain-containing protein n=1 Tax=Jiangella aurantiaca TaxID=2530373 RepID=A0A4R5A653_9ACTN|nr:sulfatase-like hydrolase/transferase [Jiangella aurantiaca]TDD67493.1 DUF4976 domain-containing protein [Jiangella aurantiaca]